MVDDNDQDMPMEDILSSIKNILEEEQNASKDVSEPNNIDDILELSPDMRMVGDPLNDIELAEESNQVASPDALNAVAEKEENTEDEATDMFEITLGQEDLVSDSFFESDSANRYNTQNDIVAETIEDTTPIFEQDTAPEAETDVNYEVLEETMPVVETYPSAAEEVKSESVQEETEIKLEANDVSKTVTQAERKEDEFVNAVEDSTVDVSANIISNFAKMFTQEEKVIETPKVEKKSETATAIGNGSKTIEDAVESVIRQIIGEEVAANWKDGLDYNNLAHQEIQKQTKEWLDNNLPLIVEKIVKQEIERVMAKVGNNQ